MQTSRRGFLGGLLAVVSAPAIVRVGSLMKLAPTEVLRPSLRDVAEFLPPVDVEFTRLDVLYGNMHVRPEWAVRLPEAPTLDDYSARVLAPMINRMQEQIAASILNGTSSGGWAGLLEATSPLE